MSYNLYNKETGELTQIAGVSRFPADYGTKEEFESKKDSLPDGTVFTTTDEFEEEIMDIKYFNRIPSTEILKNAKAVFVALRNDTTIISSFQAVYPDRDTRIYDISTGTIKYETVKWDKTNGSFTSLSVYEMSFMVII